MKRGKLQAVVVCPAGGRPDRRLLGLSVGERILLLLEHRGFEKVWFVGDGARPSCSKTLKLQMTEGLPEKGPVFVVCSDAVFSASCVDGIAPEGSAAGWFEGGQLEKILSDPEKWVAKCRQIDDGGGCFALRVTDALSARRARRLLLYSLRKPIDGFVSRHINRHVSLAISRWLAPAGISPNVLTVFIAFVGVASGVLAYFSEHYWTVALGALMFQLQSILDGCDGEVARLTYRFSHVGQWLDSIGDDLTNYAFCLGLGLGQAKATGWSWLFWFAWATFAVQWFASGVNYRRLVKLGTGDLLAIPDLISGGGGGKPSPAWLRALRQVSKRDTFVFIVMVLVLCGFPRAAYFFFAGGSWPMAVLVFINDRKISRLEAGKDR